MTEMQCLRCGASSQGFFTLTPSEARQHAIEDVCMPLVARSSQLRGIVFDEEDLAKQQADDVRSLLLSLEPGFAPTPQLKKYLAAGEAEGVPSGYKCSVRKDWWSVPSVWSPDAFMLRQLHTHPRLIMNPTAATSTDTVHRVQLAEGVDGARLAAGMINSATLALAEVVGRSYGGASSSLNRARRRTSLFRGQRPSTLNWCTPSTSICAAVH